MNKIIKWGLIGFVGLIILTGIFGGGDKQKKETTQTTKQEEEIKVLRMVTLSGVDRSEDSGTYGELAVTEINIWEYSGANDNQRGKVVGVIPHQTTVEVLEIDKGSQAIFYKIRTPDKKVEGWVSELFVLEE